MADMAPPDFDDVSLRSFVAYHWEQNQRFLPMYLHLIVAALFPIYFGSIASLSRPSSAAKPVKDLSEEANPDDDDEEEETIQKMEGLTPRDAIFFPLTAGGVLTLLYWLITKYGAGGVNMVLGIYFSLIGTYSVGKLINDTWTTLAAFVTPTYYRSYHRIYKALDAERKVVVMGGSEKGNEKYTRKSPLTGSSGAMWLPAPLLDCAWAMRAFTRQKFLVKGFMQDVVDFRVVLTRHNVASAILGVAAIAYSLFVDKPWWLTNLQGFAVSYGALQLMSPTTFTTGSMILTGLFFYDIWAVFFTPLMVTVAKNLDVPIKLVFPRPEDTSIPVSERGPVSYSMLGLGDIVLPGLMIALALRFDLYMHYLRKQRKVTKTENGTTVETVEKAPYVSVSGHWSEKFHTTTFGHGVRPSYLPAYLSTNFPKPYFYASLYGYIVGMLATLIFMSVFQHAQPALLYLVPGVLSFIWGKGWLRGEIKQMWEYTEDITGETIDEDEEKAKENKGEGKEPDEAGSFFSNLWKEIFGDSSKEEKPSDSKANDARPADIGKDVVFSFTITHHSRSFKPDPKPRAVRETNPKSKPESKSEVIDDSNPNAAAKHAGEGSSSSSSDDDAVLVGSADLEDDKSASRAA